MHLIFVVFASIQIANRNKMSMFTYGAHDDEWKHLIDLAAAQGCAYAMHPPSLQCHLQLMFFAPTCVTDTKFWVTDDGKKNPDDMAGLPHFFNDMVDYIAAMKGTDPMRVH